MTDSSLEHYHLDDGDVSDVVRQLRFILARIEDRLDKLEGRRGQAEVFGNMKVLDAEGNVVSGFVDDLP